MLWQARVRREKSEISMQERKRKGNVTSEAARLAPFDSGGVSPTGVGDFRLRLMMREFLGITGLCKEIERDVQCNEGAAEDGNVGVKRSFGKIPAGSGESETVNRKEPLFLGPFNHRENEFARRRGSQRCG